jgi:hypothetical protein
MLESDFNAALSGASVPHVRFPIYRNNVSQALVGALRVRFPVVERLVGAEFFLAMASEYISEHKPSSAVLIYYGATFADFIATFEAASSLAYLSEVAQFENVWWHAYHAAEAAALPSAALAKYGPEELGELKFKFHPAAQLFECGQGAVSIWQWHQVADNEQTLVAEGQEYVLVSRPHADVEVRLIDADGFAFFSYLKSGSSLESAVAETQTQFSKFDLQLSLAALFQLELVTGVE